MKRFVAILMAAAMLLTVLAGCSGSTKPADTTPAADSSTAAGRNRIRSAVRKRHYRCAQRRRQ